MPAWTKERCDYPKNSEKPLGVPDGLKASHAAFSFAGRLIRIERVDITILDRERLRRFKE